MSHIKHSRPYDWISALPARMTSFYIHAITMA
jgi:hypothetical protein